MRKKVWKNTIVLGVVIIILIGINLFSDTYFFRFDLTEEKRYTLSSQTKDLLKNIPKKVYAEIYLSGDLPPEFQKLKKSVKELLLEFKRYAKYSIEINFKEVDANNPEKVKRLYRRGLQPTSLAIKDKKGRNIQSLIFPGLVLHDKEKEIAVNFLKNKSIGTASENINNSIELLEYELTNALRLLYQKQKKKIGFIKGHKFSKVEIADISIQLSQYYELREVDREANLDEFSAIIILQPRNKISEEEKYSLDQYLMNGGKLLLSLDEISVNTELLKTQNTTLATYKPNNFEDQLFTYGLRINPDILLDMQAALIPIKTSLPSEPLKFTPAPWYFAPLLKANPKHPITKGLNFVKLSYINSIDFVGRTPLKKTVLLATSPKTLRKKVPCKIDLQLAMQSPENLRFNAGPKPVAVLVEGEFPSVFKNRRRYNTRKNFIAQGKPSKIIVIADDDIMKNWVSGLGDNQKFMELGFDPYTNQSFGNKDFILNAIEYLCDDYGWTSLRNREIKIRLFDKSKIYDQRVFYQLINTGIPQLFVLLFYAAIQLNRKFRYANFLRKM